MNDLRYKYNLHLNNGQKIKALTNFLGGMVDKCSQPLSPYLSDMGLAEFGEAIYSVSPAKMKPVEQIETFISSNSIAVKW
jgi:hypothetical protein